MAAAVGPPDEGEAARLAPKVMVESLLQAAYDKAAKSFVHRQMPFTEVKVQGGLTAGQVDAEEWEINDGSGAPSMCLFMSVRGSGSPLTVLPDLRRPCRLDYQPNRRACAACARPLGRGQPDRLPMRSAGAQQARCRCSSRRA